METDEKNKDISVLQKTKSTKSDADKDESDDRFITKIRGLYLIMNFLGFWPRTSLQNCYNLLWCVQMLGFLFLLFGPTAGLIVQRHDASQIIDNLGLVIPLTCAGLKWTFFSLHKKTVRNILCFMEEDWINLKRNSTISQSVPNSKRIMESYSKFARIFLYIYLMMIMITLVNLVHDCLRATNSHNSTTDFDKILPLPYSWYPVDFNRTINVQFLAVTQTITTATLSLAAICVDASFVAATLHLCGQLKILRYFIEAIAYDSSRPESCEAEVKLMVNRHQILLRAAQNIQESYNFIILAELLTCVLTMCLLGYKIIAIFQDTARDDGSTTIILRNLSLCGAVLNSIFAYCVVSDYLIDQSVEIAMAVYNAQWYHSTRSISLSFSIVMIRAQIPVEITGAQFMAMSLENFTVLMKASLSYLSVLRAMNFGED